MSPCNPLTPAAPRHIGRLHLLLACLPLVALPAYSASPAPPAPGASAVAAAPPAPAHASMAGRRKQAPAAPVKLVDINSASARQLKTLPGIGDAEAAKIIAGRPYLSKAELVTRQVMPTGPYLSIKNRVVAMQKAPPKRPG